VAHLAQHAPCAAGPRVTRPRWLPLLALPLVGLLAAAAILLWAGGGSGADDSPPATPFPTPAPVTFIPPTPLPPTPAPTLVVSEALDAPLPDLTLTTLDGAPLRLRDLRGQVVFLNFWATWCAPCRAEMPALQALQDAESERVRVVAVTDPTDGQTEADIRAFVDELGVTFAVALSSDPALYRQFGVAQIPTTYVVDPAGTIRYRHLGALTPDALHAYLDELAAP